GVLTALIAGGGAVFGATLQSTESGFSRFMPALLSIPPGALFGLVRSLFVSVIHNPVVRPHAVRVRFSLSGSTAVFIAVLLTSIGGYLSPFVAKNLESPPQIVTRPPAIPTAPAIKETTPSPIATTAAPSPPPPRR